MKTLLKKALGCALLAWFMVVSFIEPVLAVDDEAFLRQEDDL